MLLVQQFEKNIPKDERKKYGQFYTPTEIIDCIIDEAELTKDSKVLDPSCGCGLFLISAGNKLKELNNNTPAKNLFGIDINHKALEISKEIIYNKFNKKINLDNNLVFGNTITSNKKMDSHALSLNDKFKDVLESGGFDVVIGNPPYITLKKYDFDVNEFNYSQIIDGPVNCATLMIGRGLEFLKDGGILGFLLPKSVTRVDSYSKLRQFLLENTQIKMIFDLGSMFKDVRGEQIILIIKKKKPTNNNIVIKNYLDKNKPLAEQPQFFIPQKEFKGTDKLPMYDSIEQYNLIKKIEDENEMLSMHASIFRGLGLGANSSAISNTPLDEYETVLRGDSIKRFGVKYPLYIKSDVAKKASNSKYGKIKQSKVILQNIFSRESGLVATIDKNAFLTLDTVTNIIPKEEYDLHYFLGILNSKVANFYLIFAIYYKSLLTMHTDSMYIGRIPFRYTIGARKQKVIDLVKKQLQHYDKNIDAEIDEIVYSIYDLERQDIELIEGSLKKCWNRD